MPDDPQTPQPLPATSPEAFMLRTMQQDLEQIRQGMPVRGSSISNPVPAGQHEDARRLGSPVGAGDAHNPGELPSREMRQAAAQAPTVIAAPPRAPETPFRPRPVAPRFPEPERPKAPQAPKPAAPEIQKPQAPTPPPTTAQPEGKIAEPKAIAARPTVPEPPAGLAFKPTEPVRPVAPRPIEVMAPALSAQTPRPSAASIPVQSPDAPKRPVAPKAPVDDGDDDVPKVLALWTRLFPTRKRFLMGIALCAILLAAGTYAIFAYFGKPLPGTRYIKNLISSGATGEKPSPTPSSSVAPTQTPTPTPSQAPSASPSSSPRPAYLPVNRIARIILPQSATKVTLLEQLTKFSESVQHQPGDFAEIIVRSSASETPFSPQELFTFLDLKSPEGLLGEFTGEYTLFVYKPKEVPGDQRAGSSAAHLAMLIPLKGKPDTVRSMMRQWEATLSGDVAPLALGRQWTVGVEPLFAESVYQGTSIRYQNFPDPFLAVDYAVFNGSDRPMLILTTSRESMYAAIGALNYRTE